MCSKRQKTSDLSALSELSPKELISMINELKIENNLLKEKICLLETQLNQYRNESKKQSFSDFINKFHSKEVNYRRDSFSDRICDDLSQVLLQFLSLEDKIRLECVSKQFQRTVFQKQNELILKIEYKKCQGECLSYEPNVLRLKYQSLYQRTGIVRHIDPQLEVIAFESYYYKPIESLLKKCPNIQSIDLWEFQATDNRQISKLMLQMITKYCNHLIKFRKKPFNQNSFEFQEFCRKFGQKLKYFSCAEHVFDFNLFPNIKSIDIVFNVVNGIRVEEVLQLNPVNNLKKLAIVIEVNKEHLLPQVMQKFQKLTHLTLWPNTNALGKVFKDFPFTENLKELFITFRYYEDFEEMCYSLKQIAIKCPKLKRFVLKPEIIFKNISESEQLFQLLKAFPSLKRLHITLEDRTGLQTTNNWFSFQLFEGFLNS